MKIILQPIRPTHYALTLFPTLEAPFTYQGHVSITFQSVANGLAPSNQIVLNSKDLKVHSASLAFISKGEPVSSSHSNPRLQATSIIYNTQDETVTLKFGQDIIIAKDDLAILHVEFEGTHNDQMCGFYRSSYTLKTGEKEFMLSSHFEPADARRAFPCIDEPMMKATFDVTLHAPANGYVCLSNMPVVNQKEVKIVDAATGHAVNLQKYCFATTPLMSTYLLAFVVGKLEYVEQTAHLPNTSQEIPCRVYTVPGKRDEGLYSVDLACRVVEFFSSYFKIDYPLPKMDLVGIPDFPIGAMENFGLLTFRIDRLLFNESTGSSESKIRISYIVAHEIAHQWFGNLTTMKWWDELWLKEGFATFVGWLAIDHLFPDWDVFTLFLSRETVKGLALDALQASHPVRVDVSNPAEVGEIFDAISYCKGASIIRMLECYLGREVFAKGVCEYLKENLWSNADGNDLWRALNAASSGRIKVEEFMKNWTDEMGFPLLEVISEEYDSAAQEMVVEIRQSRFISSGDNSNDSQTVWNIPIGLYTYSPSASKSTYILFDSKQGKIRFPFQASPTSFWKFNADSAGFYYSFYLPQHYELLANSIERDPSCLSSKDKYGLLNETYYLLKTYRMTLSSYLVFLKCFKTESDFYVLDLLFNQVKSLLTYFASHVQIIEALTNTLKSIFSDKLDNVGFDYGADDDFKLQCSRTLVIEALKCAKDIRVVEQLHSRVIKYMAGDKSCLSSNLLDIAFSSTMQHSSNPADDFESMLSLYKSSDNLEERSAIMTGLSSSADLKLMRRWFNEILLDADLVRTQDIFLALRNLNRFTLASNRLAIMNLKWEWFTSNFSLLKSRMGSKLFPISEIFSGFVGEEFLQRIMDWLEGKGISKDAAEGRKADLVACDRQIQQSLEAMRANTTFVLKNIH